MNSERGRQFHIFVVEDNPGDIHLLRVALELAEVDCILTIASDGREALDFANQRGKYEGLSVPDLAVLDLNLPKNDGLEILEAMRANELFSAVPVVVLSSSSSPREKARVEKFHVRLLIVKPPDLELYMAIGKTLKGVLLEQVPQPLNLPEPEYE
ncbi:MAG: response regulator [Bryobacteraceae bacterium]